MTEREHDRMPYSVRVEFRTASSFLVAYSVNLSRGGLFLETDQDLPTGAPIEVVLHVPGAIPIRLIGLVAWHRADSSTDGPRGVGIELQDPNLQLGLVIDGLVGTFHGVQVLVLSGDRQDRTTLARSIKSIISTAEIMQAADASVASALLTTEVDLAVVDLDFDVDGGFATLRGAKALDPAVPVVAISANQSLRERARAEGADETATNPPSFAELQVVLVRALSKPVSVRPTDSSVDVDV
ncbi:MAG: PilZ domain-containing protein [Kofleriaceae bacterium]|nr:PilZ domain-containing protein [Kofleriaceae bacterium]